jgi:hypothetical protein
MYGSANEKNLIKIFNFSQNFSEGCSPEVFMDQPPLLLGVVSCTLLNNGVSRAFHFHHLPGQAAQENSLLT